MNAPPSRHRYHFGPTRIDAHLPLPMLSPAAEGSRADIVLHLRPAVPAHAPVDGWLHHWQDRQGATTLSLAAHADGYRLRFPGLCDFLVDADAAGIAIEPLEGLDRDTLEHLIVDQLLPRALAHRGAFVAHASAVLVDGSAVLFLGHSGWGKSTLASLLHGAGHRVLSDDCALLTVTAASVTATATYPSLRLFDDSIDRMTDSAPATLPVAAYSQKRRLALDIPDAGNAGHPVAAIFLLNDPAMPAGDHDISPIPPALACMALVEHSFRLDLYSGRHTRLLLGQAAQVQRHVPVHALRYPRDYAATPALLDILRSHLDGIRAAACSRA